MSELDLEKGFNESELEDIMSEIESLEKDFGDVTDIEEAPSAETEEVVSEEEQAAEDPVIEEPVIEETTAEEPAEQEAVMEVATEVEAVIEEPSVEEPVIEEKEDFENMLESEFEVTDVATPAEDLKIAPEAIERSPVQAAIEEEVEAMIDHHTEEIESEAEVVEMKQPEVKPMSDIGETKMDFSVSGQMNLKLNFWVNGQSIELHVSEEDGFVIEMEGGAKFSLPVGTKKAS